MEQCPICDTEFTEGKVNYCYTCRWDLTPYPINFQLPESLAQKEQAKIDWVRKLWEKMKSELGKYKSDISQLQFQFSDAQSKVVALEVENKKLLSQIKELKQELSYVKNDLEEKKIEFKEHEEKILLQLTKLGGEVRRKRDIWEI